MARQSGSTGRGATLARHRWKGRRGRIASLLDWIKRHRSLLSWSGLLLAAAGLFSWLIGLLVFAPERTPVILVTAAPYIWPLPPNAWAAEDLRGLQSLDGINLDLVSPAESVREKADVVQVIEQGLATADSFDNRTPLIVWLSLHGVAPTGGDSLFLIPPNASPTDSESWVDFGEVAELLLRKSDRPKLVILDCQRMPSNWNLGLATNEIIERVRAEFDRLRGDLPGDKLSTQFAVWLAAGRDQYATVSPHLPGSAFGHYVRQGLAGRADLEIEGGNSDGWVTLQELHQFVSQAVEKWARHNRSVRQQPVLLTSSKDADFRLTRSARPEALEGLLSNGIGAESMVRSMPSNRLDDLWQQLSELRVARLYQREPVAWRDLEHRLLWLEQLFSSGGDYTELGFQVLGETEVEMKAIFSRLAKARQSRSVAVHARILSGSGLSLPKSLEMHTLPLAEHFGALSSTESLAIREGLDRFSSQPNPETLTKTLADSTKSPGSKLRSVQFLRMLDRYQFPRMWSNSAERVRELWQIQRDLQLLAVPRNRVGLPSGERAHDWTRHRLKQLSVACRELEDQLFIGAASTESEADFGSEDAASEVANRLAQQLRQVGDGSDDLSAAVAIRDQALAEIPYWGQWLTSPFRTVNSESLEEGIRERFLPLITSSRALSDTLLSISQASPSELDEVIAEQILTTAQQDVERAVEQFSREWNQWSRRLVDDSESNSPEIVGELQAVLAVPRGPAQKRREIRNALHQLSHRLQVEYQRKFDSIAAAQPPQRLDELEGNKAEIDQESSNAEDVPPDSIRVASELCEQVLFAAIGLQERPSVVGLDPVGVEIGRMVDELRTLAELNSLKEQRNVCSRVASRFRAVAPIWFSKPAIDPIDELFRLDLQTLLLWHAENALDDFWGPAGGSRSYFDVSATQCLQAAAKLGVASPAVQSADSPLEIQELTQRLVGLRQLASRLLRTECQPVVQIDPFEPVRTTLSFRIAGEEGRFSLNEIPPGTSAVMILSADRRVSDVAFERRPAVALPSADAEIIELSLSPDRLAISNAASLRALAMFRGHEYGDALEIRPLEGRRVEVLPHRYEQSEVTLNGPWENLSVVFILDCSHSMQEPAVTGSESPQSRLEAAKNALQEIMLDLASRRNVRVGVQFFGHRLGWSSDAPVRVLVRPGQEDQVAPDLLPSQDVESVLPLGSFNLSVAQELFPRIAETQAWGQSPLYLSVLRALGEFGTQDALADRHVVVITDGANYQFIPREASQALPTASSEVLQAARESEIPVHILGLSVDSSEDQALVDEFTDLCRVTGGSFQALGAQELTRALEKILEPGRYRLSPGQTSDPAVASIERVETLGLPITLRPPPASTSSFWLSYEGREADNLAADALPSTEDIGVAPVEELVWLEGGESVSLYLSPALNEIYAREYRDNVVTSQPLVAPSGATTDYVVRMHRPRRDGDSVRFDLSWQRVGSRPDRWRFTRRPAPVWIEIQPVGDGYAGAEAAQPYVFYDVNFEPNTSVPILRCTAQQWPDWAVRASVRIWCQLAGESPVVPPPFPELPTPELPTTNFSNLGISNSELRSPGIAERELGSPSRVEISWGRQPFELVSNSEQLELSSSGGAGEVQAEAVELPARSGTAGSRIYRQLVTISEAIESSVDLEIDGVQLRAQTTELSKAGLSPATAGRSASSTAGKYRLRCILEFADSALPVSSLKLSLPTGYQQKPVRIVRQFDEDLDSPPQERRRLAVHSFYFDQPDWPTRIAVTSRDGALAVDRQAAVAEMMIDLAAPSDLLPVVDRAKSN